jgi:hypothetical protein
VNELSFAVVCAAAEPNCAAPTLCFRIRIQSAPAQAVHAILLRCVVLIDPRRRQYTPGEQESLKDVFGERQRWADTLSALIWARNTINVAAFEGSTVIEVPVSCTYDFEVAAAKYLHALEAGEVPLRFQFSGTVFARAGDGFSVHQVAWDREASYRLPVNIWRDVMEAYFPDSAWIRVPRPTLDALRRHQAHHGFTNWEETIGALMGSAMGAGR